MLKEYVVDAARAPWKPGETEGLTFHCQVLLSGDDGGPEAIRFRFDPTPSIYAHMHLTAQYQLILGGEMEMPRGQLHLGPLSIHYTDHNTPYGPFSVTPGHDMLVLHPKSGGLISMAHLNARRKINLTARLLVAKVEDDQWCAAPEYRRSRGEARMQTLIPADMGPECVAIQLPPGGATPQAEPTYGRYEVVLSGSVNHGGQELVSPGFRYVQGDEVPPPMIAGAQGATVMLLAFDADALEGGLTGEGIAVTAAQAMARAI